jgi:tight adherence protein B
MRRLSLFVSAVTVFLGAAPALAQEGVSSDSAPNDIIITVSAIAGAVSVFLLILILFGSAKNRTDPSITTRLVAYGADSESKAGVFSKFRFLSRAASTAETAAQKRGMTTMIEGALETADVPVKPGEAIVGTVGIALMSGIVIAALTRSSIWGVVASAAVVGAAVVFVNQVAARTRKKFEEQLPDTLNLVSTSLRAGYSLLQAVEAVGEEAPDPTRREFGRAMAEIRLGKNMDDSLDGIADRMGSQDFDWTVMAIGIQREVGGNLAEVLQTTAETMVHRNRLRREMKALTAEGRISAIILAILPFGLAGFIWLTNPAYLEPLLESTLGLIILAGGVVFIGIGIFWMSKIVKVDA